MPVCMISAYLVREIRVASSKEVTPYTDAINTATGDGDVLWLQSSVNVIPYADSKC